VRDEESTQRNDNMLERSHTHRTKGDMNDKKEKYGNISDKRITKKWKA